jgi:chloramphenicol O-acetyltransferase type A
MRTIDIETWSRREHFELFSAYGYPHWGLCANVDMTAFYPFIKQNGYSLTIAIVYMITRVSNSIPEFRYRIRDDKVIEHEVVNPGFTFLTEEDTFSFCFVNYAEKFLEFTTRAEEGIAYVKENPWVKQVPQDDVIYMTAIPWVSFTSFLHPMRLQPEDSIPRFVWGKIFEEDGQLKMPLGVQGHHALLDGIHAGKFYEGLQKNLSQPEKILDNNRSAA